MSINYNANGKSGKPITQKGSAQTELEGHLPEGSGSGSLTQTQVSNLGLRSTGAIQSSSNLGDATTKVAITEGRNNESPAEQQLIGKMPSCLESPSPRKTEHQIKPENNTETPVERLRGHSNLSDTERLSITTSQPTRVPQGSRDLLLIPLY